MNELPNANEFMRALRDIINSKGSEVANLAIRLLLLKAKPPLPKYRTNYLCCLYRVNPTSAVNVIAAIPPV